ncbi:DNase I-like protein [Cylindrobasidium torrendii FP15055 ss-10]|uniref:DNase I-like protein n=1 Tax=Cylindrobasidium torrendii FP15055 ss-10 TaxID=1314674 RepID=A0A0D7BE88_9AGAR|nr:DNase I-like protein [Cylindrobasidium torrendii FP15055 ss-10]
MSASRTPLVTRLHNLLPHSPHASTCDPSPIGPEMAQPPRPPAAKALKVRILTWNMHDSVPKGNIEELFGKVPFYTPPHEPPTSFPEFPNGEAHPYHLVVVAGQECPSLSGIPMGIGAGFKLLDTKDKEVIAEKDKAESIRSKKHDDVPHDALSGWTAMVEDWLSHAGACSSRRAPTPPSATPEISSPKPLSPRISLKEKKGPYQLLVKERLMGIYLAIYVHRDVRSFVEGTSRSAVTAGLIGGRVGNKGGVGISLKIHNSTFLFMNCHLAAHEGKVSHRLANLSKIKSELAVDDFLQHDDPRLMSEDLTDKFDYSFLFGDLNFRLNISRLHADWLISRADYAQALTFDQLLEIMRDTKEFDGFTEALIDFPPTFKYDVLRTLKRPKRGSRLDRWRSQERAHRLTEVEERDQDDHEGDYEGDDDDDNQGESMSVMSSAYASTHSRAATDPDEEFFDSSSPSHPTTPGSKISLSIAVNKAKAKWISIVSSPIAGQPPSPSKWLSRQHKGRQLRTKSVGDFRMESDDSETRITIEDDRANSLDGQRRLDSAIRENSTMASENSLDVGERSVDVSERSMDGNFLRPPAPPVMRSSSSKSVATTAPSEEEDYTMDSNRGVYDSSHKKRVPSWCDRILYKTTVEPEPDGGALYGDNTSRSRSRVGQFFFNALRPLRIRRESYSSTTTGNTSLVTTSTISHDSPLPSPDTQPLGAPFSRFVYPPVNSKQVPSIHTGLSIESSHDDDMAATINQTSDDGALLKRSSSMGSSRSAHRSPPSRRASLTYERSAPIADPTGGGSSTRDFFQAHPRWRFLMNPFSSSSGVPVESPTATLTPPALPEREIVRRKGDIVCLEYRTLDDRQMRNLEGRSDHRPVIGTYAVYV